MPTEQQLMDAAAKRQSRRAAREANTQTALDEQEKLSALSQQQAEQKADGTFTPPVKPVKRQSRAEQMAEKRKATKAQADRDALIMPEPVETEGKLAAYRERGEQPPLHLLNAIAAKADHAIRDEARMIANAAGKAAFDLAVGKRGRHDTVNRHRRMRDQIATAQATLAKTEDKADK